MTSNETLKSQSLPVPRTAFKKESDGLHTDLQINKETAAGFNDPVLGLFMYFDV
jgi:hypothetical protein